MKHELFVEQPNIDLKPGIRVKRDTTLKYSRKTVKQKLKNLVLCTRLEESGTNGINSYNSKSEITINLNEGDILLFDEQRGYYMPSYPMSSIEDAICDIESLQYINHSDSEE